MLTLARTLKAFIINNMRLGNLAINCTNILLLFKAFTIQKTPAADIWEAGVLGITKLDIYLFLDVVN